MAKKRLLQLQTKDSQPPAPTREDIALIRMECKSLIERTMRDFGAILDHLARLSPPQDDHITQKLKNFSKQDYKKYLDGKGDL